MDRFSRALYILFVTAALSLGVTGYGVGAVWPELQKQVGAAINANGQPASATYMLSPDEADMLDLSVRLSRVERGAYLLGFACAVGALIVSVRAQRKAVAR
jgi:hypothetical protein